MTVINMLTKQERKILNRCLVDRAKDLAFSSTINNEKGVEPVFNSSCGEHRNQNRILSLMYYLVSREKIKNKEEFTVDISCYPETIYVTDTNKVFDIEDYVLLKNVLKSNKVFSKNNITFLQGLAKSFNPPFRIQFFLTGGNFDDYEPKNINKNKIFELEECVVCIENIPTIIYADCGHQCVCSKCFHTVNYFLDANGTKCAVCKTENNKINFA